ncbi:hypothetical protein EDE08_10189 [Bradyrhizobium sp. R2.2-H]|jgi:hypothetical protein|uniref:hypothetical protein n=1 Tax=unclassified Bradyrhizobium TaxID=2631580 RepID=UPI00104BAF3C|nr:MULTISPECIES: hypothetical protein [unclassified Bradyrhizobium]TCU78310.1 hypothetical protein EDE10_10189 [Bradyrhizobium sp. Y-H1]TCU80394.1 hypothetical protein EDE08_10189 [Bradyrhizobium sp. R2.2-H]
MRIALLLTATIVGALFANPSHAGSLDANAAPSLPPGFQGYRGYMFDLSENSDRKDVDKLADNLKQQIDAVEAAGLSPRVLRFFRTVPIIASELACLDEGAATACYGRVAPNVERRVPRTLTVWDHDKQRWTNPNAVDLAVDSGLGVIMLRPDMMRYEKEAVLLHELLHAYHARLLPDGYANKGVITYYALAKSKDMLPKDSYAMKNPMEFFAVTASIFLAGKSEFHDPKSREALKEKMPDYYKYLVGVFGFDPEPTASNGPVASLK